jgi:hypothetical protein
LCLVEKCHIFLGRREKGEGRREKGEGRREKGEGRREKAKDEYYLLKIAMPAPHFPGWLYHGEANHISARAS